MSMEVSTAPLLISLRSIWMFDLLTEDTKVGKKKTTIDKGTLLEKRPGYYEYRIYYIDVDEQKKRKSFGGRDRMN